MEDLRNEREVPRAEALLRQAGLDERAVTFVVENLAPRWYAEAIGVAEETLVSRAIAYLGRTLAHQFQDLAVDIALVVPVFDDAAIHQQYLAAADVAGEARAAVTSLAGGSAEGRHRDWLRAVHRCLAARDLLGAGRLPLLPDASALQRYFAGAWTPLDVGPPHPPGPVDWAALADVEGRNEPEPRPLDVREVLALARNAGLFRDLAGVIGALESALRQETTLANDDRRAHQLVALSATIVAHMVGTAVGRSFNLLIELDSPPPTGRRIMAEYPLIGAQTLAALQHTEPAMFAPFRRPSDLTEPSLRSRWENITLGHELTRFTREQGVVGLLATAASPRLDAILDQPSGP
jgi:hypothetical protein